MSRILQVATLIGILSCSRTFGGNPRNGKQSTNQGSGLSFAFPALNFLGGGLLQSNYNPSSNYNSNTNNNNLGGVGNIFGMKTSTRTIVSTVSTVTTASFRTCTATQPNIPACAGNRRRRQIDGLDLFAESQFFMNDEGNHIQIEPTASIALIIGSTTLTDPLAVSEYLMANQPSSNQPLIYPADLTLTEIETLEDLNNLSKKSTPPPYLQTELYPSSDSPENDLVSTPIYNDDDILPTTEESPVQDEILIMDDDLPTTPNLNDQLDDEILNNEDDDVERGRVGLGKTTTITTIIRVTAVATRVATGTTAATLTVYYSGCLPQSVPIRGVPACT